MGHDRAIGLVLTIVGGLLVAAGGYNLYATISATTELLEGPGTAQGPVIKKLASDLDDARKDRDDLVAALERHLHPYGLSLPLGTIEARESPLRWEDIRPLFEAQTPVPSTGIAIGASPGRVLRMHLNAWAAMLNGAAGQNRFTYWAEEAPSGEVLTFKRLFEEVRAMHERALQTVGERHTSAAQDRQARGQALDQIRDDLQDKLGILIGTQETRRQSLVYQLRAEMDAAQQQRQADEEELRREQQNLVNERRAQEIRVAQFTAERDGLQARVDEIQERMQRMRHERALAEDRQEPDGEVLYVDATNEVVFLDLKRSDRLFPQMRLEVFGVESGVKIPKGTVEVFEIGEEVTRAAVVRRETGAPEIAAGDRVYNINYDPEKALRIVLLGRFGMKFSREDLVAAIRRNGDVWQEELDSRTDVVVVGRGYADDPAFATAKERGVRTITERALYAYLGLPE